MHEITRWDERNEWLATRERIGFIGSSDTVALQNDIWTMELYQKHDGGYSIFITFDSDESWFVCDFEDVSEVLKPACHQCKSKASCLSLVDTGSMNKCIWWGYNVLCSFVSDGDCCGNNCKVSYDCGDCIKKFLQRETRVVR